MDEIKLCTSSANGQGPMDRPGQPILMLCVVLVISNCTKETVVSSSDVAASRLSANLCQAGHLAAAAAR